MLGTVTNRTATNTLVATRTWQASDACGNSNICQQSITVLLGTPPAVSALPSLLVAAYGSDVTLRVTASGTAPMGYQWLLGGSDIPGANSNALALHAVEFTNAGVYSVLVSNAAGIAGSSAAVLDIAPMILLQARHQRHDRLVAGSVYPPIRARSAWPLQRSVQCSQSILLGNRPQPAAVLPAALSKAPAQFQLFDERCVRAQWSRYSWLQLCLPGQQRT